MKYLRSLKFSHLPYLLLYTALFFSCNKQESYPAVQVFGHAGMGMDIGMSAFHDNSLEAIQLALTLPTMNGVEVDVRMSADGTLWLYHENTLEAHTDGEGCIFEKTDVELEKLRYKSLHREKLVHARKGTSIWHFFSKQSMTFLSNTEPKSYWILPILIGWRP